jgi:hypothetical protein
VSPHETTFGRRIVMSTQGRMVRCLGGSCRLCTASVVAYESDSCMIADEARV